MQSRRKALLDLYQALEASVSLEGVWPEGNWPVTAQFEPTEFEIVVGAVLTQNTNWRNVEKGLSRLIDTGLTDVGKVSMCPTAVLEMAVRPVGFFRRKALVLKRLSALILRYGEDFYARVHREELLSISGVGPETADAILLYACARLEFIADGYTRRILGRFGVLDHVRSYQEAKRILEFHLPSRLEVYRKFHALLVEHAKNSCRKEPLCSICFLREKCQRSVSTGGGFS